MTNATKLLTTVGIALIMSASHAKADDTWFVYCEGVENGQNTAYITTALYSHYASTSHKAELERAALKRLSETRGTPIYGCSGVNFMSKASAVQSRSRTANVHKMVGNKVVMFELDAPAKAAEAQPARLQRTRLSRGNLVAVNTRFAATPEYR